MENKNNNIILLIILSFIFVILLAIFLIMLVINPNKKSVNNTEKTAAANIDDNSIGTYNDYNYSRNDIFNIYNNELSTALFNSNFEKLYGLANKGYLKYYNFDEESFKSNIENMFINDKQIEVDDYRYINLNNKNIYFYLLKTVNDYFQQDVVITEESPNNFSISFGDFLLYDDNPQIYTFDELKLTINTKLYLTSKVNYNITIENISNHNYEINTNKLYENIYLLYDNGFEYRIDNSVFFGDSKMLSPAGKINANISFSIPFLSHENIKSILIKGVKNIENGNIQDMKFNI